jgi:hypothetical protein
MTTTCPYCHAPHSNGNHSDGWCGLCQRGVYTITIPSVPAPSPRPEGNEDPETAPRRKSPLGECAGSTCAYAPRDEHGFARCPECGWTFLAEGHTLIPRHPHRGERCRLPVAAPCSFGIDKGPCPPFCEHGRAPEPRCVDCGGPVTPRRWLEHTEYVCAKCRLVMTESEALSHVPKPCLAPVPAPPPAPTRDGTLPFPDDAGPRCDACKGRGWVPGDCHPREVCGTCNGTGYPKSWAAEEIDRLDREVARLRALQSEARAAALHEAADHLDRIAPYAEDQQTTFNAQGCAREVRLLASAPPRAETGREERCPKCGCAGEVFTRAGNRWARCLSRPGSSCMNEWPLAPAASPTTESTDQGVDRE